MFDKSQKYDADKFQTAKDQITNMSADMGGTEINVLLNKLMENIF